MKNYFLRRQKRLIAKRDKLNAACQAATDAAEVRSLTEQLDELNAELRDIAEQLEEIETEERNAAHNTEERDAEPPADAQVRNGQIMGAFRSTGPAAQTHEGTVTESMEYRSAFRDFVINGTPIPVELRAGDAINTTDTSAAIPITIVREIINTVRVRYGNLYRKVRKLAVQGGVEFPIGALQADFHWISEGTVSPKQNVGALGTVSFKYHTAEIRIAQTFLSSVITMDAFEAKLADLIVIAYMKLMDIGIVNGTGNGQMLGITKDPRVVNNSGHTISMTAAQLSDWVQWRKRVFAPIPLGYRNGEFIFPLSTVETYLETMQDSNGNPVFRQATGLEVNDGDAMNPGGRFFGRDISLVEPTVLPDFDTASSGDVIGIFWQPEEYAINENFAFTMRRYFDEITNEWVDKALVIADGKVLNPEGIYLITKA